MSGGADRKPSPGSGRAYGILWSGTWHGQRSAGGTARTSRTSAASPAPATARQDARRHQPRGHLSGPGLIAGASHHQAQPDMRPRLRGRAVHAGADTCRAARRFCCLLENRRPKDLACRSRSTAPTRSSAGPASARTPSSSAGASSGWLRCCPRSAQPNSPRPSTY